jgi:hypothetical protein
VRVEHHGPNAFSKFPIMCWDCLGTSCSIFLGFKYWGWNSMIHINNVLYNALRVERYGSLTFPKCPILRVKHCDPHFQSSL